VGFTRSGRPRGIACAIRESIAWFRQDGAEHVITDEGVLRDIERAMEPQKKVNAQQDQVNRLQSAVNDLQAKVNSRQNDVNRGQDKVNSQQAGVNAAQSGVNKRQEICSTSFRMQLPGTGRKPQLEGGGSVERIACGIRCSEPGRRESSAGEFE
jgi:hypothetical protein